MEEQFFTLADLERITDAKRRQLQLWAEAGAIKVEGASAHGGRGAHRRFSRTEAIIACLLRPFADRQMAIGEIVGIGAAIRALIDNDPDNLADLEGVMIDDWPTYLIFSRSAESAGWQASLMTMGKGKRANEKLMADVMAVTLPMLDQSESMAHIIKVNTYLRRV